MFDRFRNFLNELSGDIRHRQPGAPLDDPRVAAAALLFHVMDADGVRDRAETEQARRLIAETFDVSGAELDDILSAGEEADAEAVDLYAFTSIVDRHLDRTAKMEFVSILWEMVFADGEQHEMEDNVVWRIAELIHVEREDRIGLRNRARDATIGNG